MKERPILFNSAMIRAILDGRKTMTRRVMKDQDLDNRGLRFCNEKCGWEDWHGNPRPCPYGTVGDELWCKETWSTLAYNKLCHDYDDEIVYKADNQDWEDYEGWRWKPSIFMPRWASRVQLKITDIRVERLQEISVDDVEKEGCALINWGNDPMGECPPTAGFAELWDSINAKREYSWKSNPWVWVISFERINKDGR